MEPPRLVGKLYSNRKAVSVLTALFGISSWIEVNGLWVELPLLLSKLPDAGVLPSYIVILTQAANLGPILYSLARIYYKDRVPDKILIHLTMMVGTTASLLLIWLWDKTSYVGGSLHSTAFLSLTFFLSIVDCTSSVLYFPFVGRMRQEHLLPFLIGEGLSGLLPALVALAQGVGGNPHCVPKNDSSFESNSSGGNFTGETIPVYPSPRFSVEAFFGFLVAMLVVSWTAFTILSYMPATIDEKNEGEVGPASVSNSTTTEILSSSSSLMQETGAHQVSKLELVLLLFLQAFICCLTNGFLPSLQSFSCLPYGNVAYHLSVTLASLAAD